MNSVAPVKVRHHEEIFLTRYVILKPNLNVKWYILWVCVVYCAFVVIDPPLGLEWGKRAASFRASLLDWQLSHPVALSCVCPSYEMAKSKSMVLNISLLVVGGPTLTFSTKAAAVSTRSPHLTVISFWSALARHPPMSGFVSRTTSRQHYSTAVKAQGWRLFWP